MWFIASITGMIWATYAAFCESLNRSASKQHTQIVGFHRRSKGRILIFHAVLGSGIFRRLPLPFST